MPLPRGDVTLDGQVVEERLDLRLRYLRGMAFAVEQDEALYPARVGDFRSDAEVLEPQRVTYLRQRGGGAAYDAVAFLGVAAGSRSVLRLAISWSFYEFRYDQAGGGTGIVGQTA